MIRTYASSCLVAALVLLPVAVLGGCAVKPPTSAKPVPSIKSAPPPPSVVQVGFGQQAYYAVCTGSGCSKPTAKTLATVPVVSQPVTVPRVEPAPVASEPLTAVVRFANNSARLDVEARKVLDTVVPHLGADVRVLVLGRTDSVGTKSYNDALARRRAVAVRAYLVKASPLMAQRIRLDASGDCCFVAPNASPAGRAKNRRAVVKLSPSGPRRPASAAPK